MLLDANLLLYAVDETSPFHASSSEWLTQQLNGARRVGFPWQSVVAFLRISTHPRASTNPLSAADAWAFVEDWLGAQNAWIPTPGARHAVILGELMTRYHLTGNLIGDAHLAALALEHGLSLCSADSDFARFAELTWHNPIS